MAAKKKHAKLHNAFASPLLWGAVGFLCYLPYFLAFYPGVTTPDSIWQIRQALHLVPYNSQHPFLHTLFIELCMRIGGGDVNRGNAVYSLLQMGFLCVCYQAVLTMLRKELAPRWFLVLCWMFFFLCPYCAVYSITMWKDVPFGAAVLVLFVYVWHRCRRQAVWTPGARILFFVLSLLVSLLRSNGFIAWCIFILVFALADWRRFRRLLVPSVLVILCTILWNGPIQNACGVEKADFTEALSIPLQQVTYTVIEDEKDEEHGSPTPRRISCGRAGAERRLRRIRSGMPRSTCGSGSGIRNAIGRPGMTRPTATICRRLGQRPDILPRYRKMTSDLCGRTIFRMQRSFSCIIY